MKLHFFSLILIFSLASCEQSSNSDNTTIKKASTTATKNNLPEKKEACEYFSNEEIAAFMNWDAATIRQDLMMSLEKYNQSYCSYSTPEGESFAIRVSWKSEKAQQNKVLQNQHNKYIKDGEKKIIYQKTESSRGTESIFGIGPNRFNKEVYILRTRFENEVGVIIEGSFPEGEGAKFEKLFKEILEKL